MFLKILLCVISTLFGYVATFLVWVWGSSLWLGRANADNTPQQSALGMLGLVISVPGAIFFLGVALYMLRARSAPPSAGLEKKTLISPKIIHAN
jgi:hypothetical protein